MTVLKSFRRLSFVPKIAAFLIIFASVLPVAASAAGCSCKITASAWYGTSAMCTQVKSQGAQCTYDTATDTCNCAGAVPSIDSKDKCNEAGVRDAYSIPDLSSVPGMKYTATCNWSDASTGLDQQQIDKTGQPTAPTTTPSSPAAPTTPAATLPSTSCNTSSYNASANHGLLNGIQPQCAVCGQCSLADIFTVGNTITKLILGLSGSVMLLMIIYGGFLWLTSEGNSSRVESGKKVMFGAIIGIVIVFGAYTATQFILGALGVPNATEVFGRPFQTKK